MMVGNDKELLEVAAQRLEEYDFLKVSSKLQDYNIENSNRVFVVLPEYISTFGAFIELRVEIKSPNLAEGSGNVNENLISVSIDWPPSQPSTLERRPVNVINFSVTKGKTALESASLIVSENELTILAERGELKSIPGEIKITLLSPSLYLLLPGIMPFQRHLLSLNLSIPCGQNKTILFLDHSSKISLRCRKDNSEYQSLAYSVDANQVRKITFFPLKTIKVKYYYGINDQSQFIKLAVPLYSVGLSLLAGSLALAFVQADLRNIAAPAFALLLLPPFLQLFSRSNIFYPSSDINRLTIENMILVLVTVIYLPLASFTIFTLIGHEQYRSLSMKCDLIAGGALILSMIIYMLLIDQGVLQHFTCDSCERRIWLRRKAKLNLTSRKTVCQACWRNEGMASLING